MLGINNDPTRMLVGFQLILAVMLIGLLLANGLIAEALLTFLIEVVICFVLMIRSLARESQNTPMVCTIVLCSLSCASLIGTFAVLFKKLGIESTGGAGDVTKIATNIYFSGVTFTTLGYGDFRPSSLSQLLACGEALAGYISLGLAVAAIADSYMPGDAGSGDAGPNDGSGRTAPAIDGPPASPNGYRGFTDRMICPYSELSLDKISEQVRDLKKASESTGD